MKPAELIIRAVLLVGIAVAVGSMSAGCTITRNAPLVSSEIQINDSANNNEIPLR